MDPVSRLLSLSTPVVIAHRGGGALRPENTMAAFEHAQAIGADAIECDVHLSRDEEVVVIHDDSLDRTTDATGPVAARTARELAGVDAGFRFGAGSGFPFRGRGGVPRLTDVLTRTGPMPVVVELKGDHPAVARRVLDVVREAGAESRVIVGGFSDAVLGAMREIAPELPTSASRREAVGALRRAYVMLAPWRPRFRLFQVPLAVRGKTVLTRRFVRTARRAGLPVQVWVIDEPAEMKMLLEWGVTGLISDRPDVALTVIQDTNAAHRDAAL